MLPDLLVSWLAASLALTVPGLPLDAPPVRAALTIAQASLLPAAPAAVSYLPASREVNNWRHQAAAHLDLDPAAELRLRAGNDPAGITRCVRLNNYWCIKKNGWAGEIAADGEGHVAFASALEGGAVAAILLRRYYLNYGRKSALAIVSRWAPAGCGPVTSRAATKTTRGGFALAQKRRAMGPEPKRARAGAPDGLAIHGVRNTLRARFLASHGRSRVAARGSRARPGSRVASLAMPMMPAPSIMAGGGERSAPKSIRLASLSMPELDLGGAKLPPLPPLPALPACVPDTARVNAYAAAAARGVVAKPSDDLKLFEADGTPTANLAAVMRNMAAVEIGPRRVDDGLIAEAIALATRTRPAAAP